MKKRYSFSEIIKNAYSIIFTKFFYKDARLIRKPLYIRCKYKNNFIYGKGLTTGYCCRIELDDESIKLEIGINCGMGDYTYIVATKHVKIGNNVLITSHVYISDSSHGNYGKNDTFKIDTPYTALNTRKIICKDIIIGNNVWMEENVVILLGIKIGDGAIVGVSSVVTKDVDKYTIVVGNPAKPIKNMTIKKRMGVL
uniref:hypothetical protein n=1 Tax=Candidatus Stoquefichus sp. SB1 TaxID=1658109 RepID=UPI00067F0272|nr:hypothetical protein [Candidatus Stoquefichus sp. SB1]